MTKNYVNDETKQMIKKTQDTVKTKWLRKSKTKQNETKKNKKKQKDSIT